MNTLQQVPITQEQASAFIQEAFGDVKDSGDFHAKSMTHLGDVARFIRVRWDRTQKRNLEMSFQLNPDRMGT